jgi:hypothetical protein
VRQNGVTSLLTLSKNEEHRSTRPKLRSNRAVTAASPQIRDSCRAYSGRVSAFIIRASCYRRMGKLT